MRIALVRHATLVVEMAGVRLLIDPMLDPAGAQPPIPDTPNPRPNPLVDLPRPAESLVAGLDAVVVTHLHPDHIDATAGRLLPRDVPVLCQPAQEAQIRSAGLQARPLDGPTGVGEVTVTATDGRHGPEELARELGPVMGVVLTAPEEPTLYVAGDTVMCPPVVEAIEAHRPDLIVVNAGAAQFTGSAPITMDADDVIAVAEAAPDAAVLAVHMEAINHCPLTRADLMRTAADAGLAERVLAPPDGQMLEITV
jgi:L-ascorbate metabolism protein UlaG (beta-lactamase superfamily)